MTRAPLLLIIAALVLIALSWWGVVVARTGLVVRTLEREGVPLVLRCFSGGCLQLPFLYLASYFLPKGSATEENTASQ